jgi:hypothetical protein
MNKALVVGINEYPSSPLYGCCNDANRIERLLLRNEDGSPNFSVKKRLNVNTKGKLKALIKDCFSGDDDTALFYYSGHGHIDSVGGYLVTPDYSQDDWGVSLNEILQIANESRCKNKVIILDSCFSGFMGSISTANQDTAVIKEGVTILTASRNDESSMEVDGQGLFTSLLIEALSGRAADVTGHVTPSGIYSYIDKALGPWDQRPVFKTNVTRFVSLRKVKPRICLESLRRLTEFFVSEDDQMPLDPSYEPTNTPEDVHEIIEPYATKEHTNDFSILQEMEGVGLVVPVGEKHMYYAAMRSKTCELTALGKHYWKLVSKGMI